MRVSTQEQARAKADPLGRQRLNLEMIGERLGQPDETNIYIDRQSGKRDDRPNLQALLTKISGRQIDWVACDRIDRIGRSIEHNLRLWSIFKDSGVALFIFDWGRFVNFDAYQGAEDWDRFVNDSVVAEKESRVKGRRSHAAHRYNRHLRKANYIMPFGYIRTSEGETKLNLGQYSERHSVQDVVVGMRDIYLSLGSFRGAVPIIAKTYSHKISPVGLARWLCNPVLRGHTPRSVNPNTSLPELYYEDIDLNTHPSEVILTESQYQRVLELRRRNHGGRTQKGKTPTPLAGLCRCALCGYSLTLSTWKGKKKTNRYLACHGRRTRAPESGCWKIPRGEWASIRYEVVENALLLALAERATELANLEQPGVVVPVVSAEDLKVGSQIDRLRKLGSEIGSDFSAEIAKLEAKLQKPKPNQANSMLIAQLVELFSYVDRSSFIAMLLDEEKYDLYHRFVDQIIIDRCVINGIRLKV